MQEILSFLMVHWVLALMALVFLVMIVFVEGMAFSGTAGKVNPAQLVTWINRKNALVVDIRAQDVFDTGHIVGAIHVSISSLSEDQKTWPVALRKAKDKPVVVVCNSGMTAQKAVSQLQKKDYQSVHSLQGGMMAWKQANLPTVI